MIQESISERSHRRDHGDILSRTQLFLIDEVRSFLTNFRRLSQISKFHILNESRGSTLEVVASRMNIRGSFVRFMLVSATVPNIDDIAAWIGCGSTGSPAAAFDVCLLVSSPALILL